MEKKEKKSDTQELIILLLEKELTALSVHLLPEVGEEGHPNSLKAWLVPDLSLQPQFLCTVLH